MSIGHYEPSLVVVSILVAVYASHTALSLAERVRHSHGRATWWWMGGGAFAMGSGIWAMHFIGMQAFRLPFAVGYDTAITLVSWLLPVLASALALSQISRPTPRASHFAVSALLMGLGINAMHYTGMAAMRMRPGIDYDPLLFALSVLIAIGASAGALWLAFHLRHRMQHGKLTQLAAAVVMGGAIVGMHYTGMEAAHFDPGSICLEANVGISQDLLAGMVTVTALLLLTIATLVAVYDSRLEERARILAERQALYLDEQKARVEAERLSDMKDEFLSTLSHELRTPLNAMLGWAQLLMDGGKDEKMLKRGLQTIERNARAQSQLIEDMLDMSRLIAGQLRIEVDRTWPADFIAAAVETVRPGAMAKNVRLEMLIDSHAGPLAADAARLQQVMTNLLSNAIKFTPAGGSVRVSAQRVGDAIAIAVSDTGIGIAPEFLPHVFDRFRQADASSTRRHGGLGLGLSIARQLVELQGGQLTVASAGAGAGSTFTLTMPLPNLEGDVPAAPDCLLKADDPDPVRAGSGALAGRTILVVDDERDSLDIVHYVLADMAATIVTAATAYEALHLIDQLKPDLMVSDIGMPGMDGLELMRRVRASGNAQVAGVRALALTAFSRHEDRLRSLEAGFDEYLSKPVAPVELARAVLTLCEGAPHTLPAPAPSLSGGKSTSCHNPERR
ncbi:MULTISPECIES: MHYT domain-containing protein [unclassified Massilia]|uniref:MHYT domain-containing protein n=1 Tax=unclassified Massilia TaxID=2609279 RepID=UPI00178167D5|nr:MULTISPECIES: MHYT domain-containing protein [unclassified Massilia]MBD8529667.1 response regulator [Massilia sp. CFBP 13647]MBD8673246.1 response regulator [Massilia sp. CFBP 13721]